jgi:hypothetical protein
MSIKSLKCQPICPFLLVKVEQHFLLQFILPVINCYGVIMPIQTMDQGLKRKLQKRSKSCTLKRMWSKSCLLRTYLNWWLIQMPEIGCGLPWFLAQHHSLWVDKAECINDHLPLDALNWIYHYSYSPLIQSFKALQRIKGYKKRLLIEWSEKNYKHQLFSW